MEPNLIDGRLDRSAPTVGAALSDADVRIMLFNARPVARVRRRRRSLRVGATAGVVAVLLSGGGVAFAQANGWWWTPTTWAPRYEQPDASFSTTLPSGRVCEVRAIAVAASGGRTGGEVNVAFREWLKSADLKTMLDLPSARAEVAQEAAQSPDQTVALGPEGLLMDVPRPPTTRTADDVQAEVIQYAARDVLMKEADALSMDFSRSTFNLVIKCDPVAQ